ncbi:hypothetical protein RAAC3_TM7C00001G0126 [Candidatus Saccharibacteria bacterium RAAC3_TM7_1]|nr:hypothetical protein RAAC3_TM7C00001G0126 [Candidatus Saccharibacteria bacterium RAAC3_TM7_1]HCZ28831.1 hypothetical protein [Candidatus Saccharibacteria bacterium]
MKYRTIKFARISLAALAIILGLLFVLGFAKDISHERCSGLMGVETSCVEQYAIMPLIVIGLPLGALFVAILLTEYMSKDNQKKPKKRR